MVLSAAAAPSPYYAEPPATLGLMPYLQNTREILLISTVLHALQRLHTLGTLLFCFVALVTSLLGALLPERALLLLFAPPDHDAPFRRLAAACPRSQLHSAGMPAWHRTAPPRNGNARHRRGRHGRCQNADRDARSALALSGQALHADLIAPIAR